MQHERSALITYIQKTLPIEPEKAETIASHFTFKTLKKGDIFLQTGKVSNEYLFLENGFARSYLLDTEGNEVTMNLFGMHEMVFEVASFFQRTPSEENIEALADTSGWVLTYQQLNTLFHAIPEFREFGRAVLVKGFVAFKNRTLSMINKTAEQRYEDLLRFNPEVLQNAPLKYIASYLGVTDTSLSRIRKEFSRR
jgi:CRP-like cAMP-binding protein